MAKRKGIRQQLSAMRKSGQALENQIQNLIKQKKYTTAIRKLQQGLKRNPDEAVTVSEADLWLLEGRYEFERAQYPQAEKALRQALSLELYNDTYYWLAKCFLAQQKPAAALEIFQTAFDDKTLPKDMGGCYLKLLFLNDQSDAVEELIKIQAKRFYAPHLNWAKGAIALKSDKPKAAVAHFKKMGRSASPGDQATIWPAYAQQQAGNWASAEKELPSIGPAETKNSFFGGSLIRYQQNQHPAVQRLILAQAAHSDRAISAYVDIDSDLPQANVVSLLELLHLIGEDDFHEAAHLALDISDEMMAQYPELEALYRPLMLLAGTQAMRQDEVACTATFWNLALEKAEFDPPLALNLYRALDVTGAYRQAERLVNQLILWLKQAAQKTPQDWPKERLNPALAKLYCWSADCQMSQRHYADAKRSVQLAEQLAPDHPDVIGRKGLNAFARNKPKEAIELLNQALEAGCQFIEVYETLLQLEEDPDTVKAIRRKFGKHFDDTGVDSEVDIPTWVEALGFENYKVMEEFVRDAKRTTPMLKAFQIFLDSADDEPSSGQKITLNLKKAVPQWATLLESHPPAEQVDIIQAIYLLVQQHAKRNKKGMAAFQSDYYNKLIELASQQVPGADIAQLVILAVRSPQPDQLKTAVEHILIRTTQPGYTLARAQLALRRFGSNRAFKLFIEAQLKKDSQNPLLLLANATLYSRKSAQYATFHDRGFELARRLQDAEALQAFREEEWFEAQDLTRRVVGPNLSRMGDPGGIDMMDMLKRLAREAFGAEVPPEILAQMIPELAAEMAGGFVDDEDDFDDPFDPFFLPPPPPRRGQKKSSKKRKS
ncbi:MAG: hypothetical protein WBC73_09725 [Phormidesmis sp.]